MMKLSELFLHDQLISMKKNNIWGFTMRDNYDFTHSKKNSYSKKLKKQITIRLEEGTIEYFKNLAEEMNIPYQNLINLYLKDCAKEHKKLKLEWV